MVSQSRFRAAATVLCAAAAFGCAFRLPELPPLPATAPTPLRIFIVVEPTPSVPDARAGYWTIASEFAASLEAAGFVPVLVATAADAPVEAPVAERASRVGECFSEPLLFAVSFGVIPHVGCVEYGYRFALRRSLARPPQPIDTHYTIRAVYGWLVAPFLALAPGWVMMDVPPELGAAREAPALRAAILKALADEVP